MADLVGPDRCQAGPLAGHVSVSSTSTACRDSARRPGPAVPHGDAARAMAVLDGESPDVSWVRSAMPQRSPRWSEWQSTVPSTGDARHRRRRRGGAGSRNWRQGAGARDWVDSAPPTVERIEAAVAERVPPSRATAGGRPAADDRDANDALNGLSNGDVGVVVTDGDSVAVAMAALRHRPPFHRTLASSNGGGP